MESSVPGSYSSIDMQEQARHFKESMQTIWKLRWASFSWSDEVYSICFKSISLHFKGLGFVDVSRGKAFENVSERHWHIWKITLAVVLLEPFKTNKRLRLILDVVVSQLPFLLWLYPLLCLSNNYLPVLLASLRWLFLLFSRLSSIFSLQRSVLQQEWASATVMGRLHTP